jgi:hypothetical protein
MRVFFLADHLGSGLHALSDMLYFLIQVLSQVVKFIDEEVLYTQFHAAGRASMLCRLWLVNKGYPRDEPVSFLDLIARSDPIIGIG